jgi:hypothetical protein
MKNRFLELFGWYGTIAIIGAYAMTSFTIISPQSFVYQLLNITGAIGIVSISLAKKTYQPAVLNILWALVGIMALLKIFLNV